MRRHSVIRLLSYLVSWNIIIQILGKIYKGNLEILKDIRSMFVILLKFLHTDRFYRFYSVFYPKLRNYCLPDAIFLKALLDLLLNTFWIVAWLLLYIFWPFIFFFTLHSFMSFTVWKNSLIFTQKDRAKIRKIYGQAKLTCIFVVWIFLYVFIF